MKVSCDQDMVTSSDEFETGCTAMCGAI